MDDEPDLCEIFSDYFSSEQVQVLTFSKPDEALSSIKTNPPDLIFLDYQLPGTTGDLIAHEIVKILTFPVPIYLVTGNLEVKTDFIFDKKFEKPMKSSDIQEIIDNYTQKT